MSAMEAALLGAGAPSVILILGGLLKISRQAGRIEEGVKWLYDRVGRLETWRDTQRQR